MPIEKCKMQNKKAIVSRGKNSAWKILAIGYDGNIKEILFPIDLKSLTVLLIVIRREVHSAKGW